MDETTIEFPSWVRGPTVCWLGTGRLLWNRTRHGVEFKEFTVTGARPMLCNRVETVKRCILPRNHVRTERCRTKPRAS